MKIVGLGEKLKTLKGQEFQTVKTDAEGNQRLVAQTFGETLFDLALEDVKGADTQKKMRQYKTAQKIANAATEVELDASEIDDIKLAAGSDKHNAHFYGCVCAALDNGGIILP